MSVADCAAKDVRVTVIDPDSGESTELVTVNEGVETHVRKEGAASINYLSNVYFPYEWGGQDVSNDVSTLGETVRAQIAYVEFRPHDAAGEDDWRTIHWGYTKQVGSGGEGREMQLQLGDWTDFLGKVRASQRFNGDMVSGIVQYVGNELANNVNILDDVVANVETDFSTSVIRHHGQEVDVDPLRDTEIGDEDLTDAEPATKTNKSFTSNRDTLIDVMNWLSDLVGGYWWVGHNGDPETPIASLNFSLDHPRQNWGLDDVTVRQNNSLYEIQPINQAIVRGESPFSIGGVKLSLSSTPAEKYPIVLARHQTLYERAGENAFSQEFEEGANTLERAQSVAKKRLVEELSSTDSGRAVLNGSPSMLPYGSIEMRPVCNGIVETDVEPITFEIESLKHICPAKERYATEIDVSVHANPDDIIFPDVEGFNTLAEE